MNFDPVLLAPRIGPMKDQGLWRDETPDIHMQRALAHVPDKQAVIAYVTGAAEPIRLTYRELEVRVDRIARGLAALGVGRQDVVTFQLPNCWEFVALTLACVRIGAVANPVMPIFRQRELKFILNLGESKVFIVPKTHRRFDYEAMARQMLPELPFLQHLIVVDGAGEDSFEARLMRADAPALSGSGLSPDEVLLLMYTSGTTGEPKGVMHTSNTLFAALHAYIEAMELGESDIVLGASPMAHLTGYGYLALLPIILNATTVLQPVWEAREALRISRAEGVTFSMASTAFVSDLCNAVQDGEEKPPTFGKFLCSGAPIPPVLIDRAFELMGMRVCSAWGMTEMGSATVTVPALAWSKSSVSDGRPIRGMEVKVVDVEGKSLPFGETGEILFRGASLFAGYLKRPELNHVDAQGWFETGDRGFLNAEGYLRIAGRSKDLVIRGGENIPVIEVENLLYKHPSVSGVAIVGYPDSRLGERMCAFVVLRPGSELSLATVSRYFDEQGVAKQYCPERLEIVDDLPHTPSGKIQKYLLRDIARAFGDAA